MPGQGGLPAVGQAVRQELVQDVGRQDLLHGGLVIVRHASPADLSAVERHVAGPRVEVARLAHAADVYEILRPLPNVECFVEPLGGCCPVLDKGQRHMRVAKEADLAELVAEVGGGGLALEDVVPEARVAQRTVDEGEVFHIGDHGKLAEVFAFEGRKVPAGPEDAFLRHRRKELHGFVARGVVVVVALHHRAIEVADQLQAGFWVGVVAHHVAGAGIVGHLLALRVLEDGAEGLQIGMDIA